ncbi:MAG: 4Fe-4S binding protein [Candidatus Hydrogenedentota bacterium]|nr:MAG: 4Fe-4S binding protein [Candidatus Hydrogenedentota bacterium]
MGEDVYTRLREFLDKLPGGYPPTDTGVEIKILKKLFTPQDAELTMKLKSEPEEVSVIAKRLGMDESEAAEKLEDLAKRGLIFRVREGDTVHYMAIHFIVGIYEFQLNTLDRELAELFEEYLPYLGMAIMNIKTKQLRVAPVDSAVEAAPTVATYNRIRELVKGQELIAMSPCICRKEQRLLGNECDRPSEMCFSFGQFAQYSIDNGTGRRIGAEEAMKLLDQSEEAALVLSPSNTQELSWICCCCKCCCPSLRGLKPFERPVDYVHSYYCAVIDPEACSACSTCVDRCQIDAIEEKDETVEVNPARCIGCGLCVPTCPEEAISLEEKSDVEAPPADLEDMMARIAEERGVG